MSKQESQTPREQRADLKEAIRVNESLLCEQQAHLAMHSARLESFDWKLESIRQQVDRQHRLKDEAPGCIQRIQAKLVELRESLAKVEQEQAVTSTKVTMRMVCERLQVLLGSSETSDQGKALLKGINSGVSLDQLWVKYGGK